MKALGAHWGHMHFVTHNFHTTLLWICSYRSHDAPLEKTCRPPKGGGRGQGERTLASAPAPDLRGTYRLRMGECGKTDSVQPVTIDVSGWLVEFPR